MGHCRNTISALEETLDADRSAISKLKKSVKCVCNTGNEHVSNEVLFAENLEKLGTLALTRDTEPDIGAAFLKFSVVTKELSAILKNVMQNFSNCVLFPMDSLLKNDLKGQKGDLKKPFDKAWKEYESKYTKIEREKRQLAKEVGMIRAELSGPEIAMEMEKERRSFQLQACEYLIKINEIKAKKGVDFLQHLVEFCHSQNNYFQDGLKTLEHFKSYVEELTSQLQQIKQQQDEEKKDLLELRNTLRGSLALEKESTGNNTQYNVHQQQGNKAHGSEKHGYLYKRSDGIVKKNQKRKCSIKNGYLSIAHSTSAKPPVKLNLLTCQVKLVPEDQGGKKCFDLITRNRTYHFSADTEEEIEEWMSVLNNSREQALRIAFDDDTQHKHLSASNSVIELSQSIVKEIKLMPGNNICCDCSMPDPMWLSTNLGVLVCIECSGGHRDMGVHISRVQSLELDKPGTAQLLLATTIGNSMFNDIMEKTLDLNQKPTPTSSVDEKGAFIRSKYEQHKYVEKTNFSLETNLHYLERAVESSDIRGLLQVFAEGVDLMTVLPNHLNEQTALHLAVDNQDYRNLYIVDFIVQNSIQVDRKSKDGNSALHICSMLDRPESLKILLRSGIKSDIVNKKGETPLDIAQELQYNQCVDLLKDAAIGKYGQCENVNVAWGFSEDSNDDGVEFSDDDELEERVKSPVKRVKCKRPVTITTLPSNETNGHSSVVLLRDRSQSSGSRRDKAATTGGMVSSEDSNGEKPTPATRYKDSYPPPPPPPHASRRKRPPPPPPGDGRPRTESDPIPPPSPPPPQPPVRVASSRDSPPIPPPKTNSLIEHMQKSDQSALKGRPISTHIPSRTQSQPQHSQSVTLPRNTALAGSSHMTSSIQSSTRVPPVPVPKPRLQKKVKRVQALYDCDADNEDEITFKENEIIIVTDEADAEWWVGEIEGQRHRKGFFPVDFVHVLAD
ncbi:arf-GAP with SH3 domain, ANK repeat and PH domain-containing protein 2-like [Saccoglossus kowalevskii]